MGGFLLLLITISLVVFLSKPKQAPTAVTFNRPKVNIDMSVFDSDQFKGLQLMPEMQIQYKYKATTKAGKLDTGFVTAPSEDEAQKLLESKGLLVQELKVVEIGRDNPFTPYYNVVVAPQTPVKTTTKAPAKK